MKRVAAGLAMIMALLGGMTVAETASAHGHGHVGVGIGFGFGPYWPGYWPGYWGAPYPYYYPAPYYAPVVTTPPTYIERGDDVRPTSSGAATSGPRRDWWYFCPETKTYYPYVKECAGGWQRVEPKPQAENGPAQ